MINWLFIILGGEYNRSALLCDVSRLITSSITFIFIALITLFSHCYNNLSQKIHMEGDEGESRRYWESPPHPVRPTLHHHSSKEGGWDVGIWVSEGSEV